MKKYLFILILASFYSCKNDNAVTHEKKENKVVKEKAKENIAPNQENVNDVANEIGGLYNPEEMVIKGNRVGTNNEKEDYQVKITNSDLLDNDIVNVEKHAKKVFRISCEYENRKNYSILTPFKGLSRLGTRLVVVLLCGMRPHAIRDLETILRVMLMPDRDSTISCNPMPLFFVELNIVCS